MSMTDRLTEGLLKVASKISNQRHMTAIKNAFTALLPIIITGAFCTLFSNVVCSTTTTGISLAKIDGFAWLEELTPLFTAANYATLNFFTIGTVVLIAIEMAKQLGHKETVAPVVAISAYVSLCDSFTKVAVEGVTDLVEVVNVLPREFTNAQGLFLGMIVAIVSMEIYCRLADSGKLAIKMPESVPSNVSSAFNALFPAVLTILIISAFGLLFTKVTGNSIYNMISTWIQAPLRGILTGLPGYLLIFFLSTCFWVIGIHGTQVLKPVYQATMLEAVIANTDAAANGQTPQFILNETFISCFTTMGGAGCTIGLLFAMLLASKRSDHRTIAKLSLAPGLFNINETMTFGLPIVLEMATKVIKQNNRGLTLRQQNILRMKEELNKPDEKALHPFTKYKIITYFLVILFPPIAMYRVWKKDSTFDITEKIGQTLTCVLYVCYLIQLIF